MQAQLVAAVLAGLLSTPALAAVTVSLDIHPPSENVEHAFTPGEGVAVSNFNGWFRGEKHPTTGQLYRSVGQSIVAPITFDLSAVTLRVADLDAGTLGKAIRIDIFPMAAVNAAPTTPISSQTGVLPSSMAVGDYVTFALDQEVELEAGSAYMVLFNFAEPTSSGTSAVQLGFERTTASFSSVGRSWSYDFNADSQSGVFAADSKAFTFYLQSVPEPTAAGLIVGGTALGFSLRRRSVQGD